MTNSVFHPGERLAQSHAGIVRDTAPIRPFLPPQHRDFFESLALLPIATVPPGGAPIATFLTGPSGRKIAAKPDLPTPDDQGKAVRLHPTFLIQPQAITHRAGLRRPQILGELPLEKIEGILPLHPEPSRRRLQPVPEPVFRQIFCNWISMHLN